MARVRLRRWRKSGERGVVISAVGRPVSAANAADADLSTNHRAEPNVKARTSRLAFASIQTRLFSNLWDATFTPRQRCFLVLRWLPILRHPIPDSARPIQPIYLCTLSALTADHGESLPKVFHQKGEF